MLENNNLSYVAQNHSSVPILKHFVYRWQMNITADPKHDNMINIVYYYLMNRQTEYMPKLRYRVDSLYCGKWRKI